MGLKWLSQFIFIQIIFFYSSCTVPEIKEVQEKEKTAFQTTSKWLPEIDVQADIAIIYGAEDKEGLTFKERVDSWKEKGYQTHFMTGIAWGEYKDYYLGEWDGENHMDVTQVEKDGDSIMHGPMNPYVVPVASFIKYMKEGIVKKVIDAGISSIYLEEPEFWSRAGYSEPFKNEWQSYYGFPWKPQHESPENTYLSNKLKYHMYFHAIEEVSTYAKEYGKQKGLDVKIYIPTHSLVNYSAWMIVSPEASLASLPSIDGYIAQVWTGTSRAPTYFNGLSKERVFENAFLEYGAVVSMTAPTNRKVFLLTDPIEDRPRNWQDYKRNYEATFTAKILYPMAADYEVMPWPERIYTRPFRLGDSEEEVLIPRYYSTQMQVMINALNDMPTSENKVSGSQGIGVLMCNSLMFQRFPEHDGYDDPLFSNFYGQTLPLIKRGIPVNTVHIENLEYSNTLKDIKVLIMSYSNMKPMEQKSHHYLAEWIKGGGVLIYCGRDNDPYQNVMEWWNTNENNYSKPSEHLFEVLGINPEASAGKYDVGEGTVYVVRQNPKEFVMGKDQDTDFMELVKEAFEKEANACELKTKNSFYLERGPYTIVSVMDESISSEPFKINKPVIDLFDPELPVLEAKVVGPGTQALLYDLGKIENKDKPKVLASASRIYNEISEKNSYSFIAKSPLNTTNTMRIYLPTEPKEIDVKNSQDKSPLGFQTEWDKESSTYWMSFENSPDGISVSIQY